jgi:hypothetical protein
MDCFSVPTFTFGILYCFLVVAHDRRQILNFSSQRTSFCEKYARR